MLRLFSFSLIVGSVIGISWTIAEIKFRPKVIPEPNYDFIKRNEKVESNGETFEIFWPALDKLENLK